MILPPTQRLLSCSFGLTGWVEFPERLCGPDLGEEAQVLLVCESDGEVQSEPPASLLGDGTEKTTLDPLPWSPLIFSVLF